MRLDPELGVALHEQLRRQIVMAIEDGQYPPGAQLPSLRALAGFLRINRNTVARCYQDLEAAGWLRSEAGRGHFVRSDAPRGRAPGARRIADEALQAARAAGVDPREVALLLLARAQWRTAAEPIAFVECTPGQTRMLAGELEAATGMGVRGILLDQALAGDRAFWQGIRIVATTFHHAEELQSVLTPLGITVRACLLRAHIDTLRRLAALAEGARIGIACSTREGTERIRASLELAGFDHLDLVEGSLEEPEELADVLDGTELVVCSSGVADALRRLRPEAEIVVDDREIMPESAAEIVSLAGRLHDDGV